MRVAIIGSRDFKNLQLVTDYVKGLEASEVVVSGGARGADTAAEEAAKDRVEAGTMDQLPIIFEAEWEKYGKKAGLLRNATIVKNCDRLVAFWDEKSKGTRNSIGLALKRGLPIQVYTETGYLLMEWVKDELQSHDS